MDETPFKPVAHPWSSFHPLPHNTLTLIPPNPNHNTLTLSWQNTPHSILHFSLSRLLAFQSVMFLHILFRPPRMPFHVAPPYHRISSFKIPFSYHHPYHSSLNPPLICSNSLYNPTLYWYYDLPTYVSAWDSRMLLSIFEVYKGVMTYLNRFS